MVHISSKAKRVSLLSLIALLPFVGCAANMKERYTKDRPIPNVTTTTRSELERLPKPAQKLVVSVWKIPDETGQNIRSTQGGTELSRAVTQGAHHMLIKALNDSGWFIVVEREGWPQLIQEIRIKEELRKRGVTRVPEDFTHLAVPQYMLSGAITEFEDHPVSGGFGGGWRGFFTSSRVTMASVAIDLRMADVETGVIDESVSIFKRILSSQADLGIFRFLTVNELLEFEFGYTFNEPTQLAVREALEKGVVHLIVKGVRDGLGGFVPAKEEDMKFFKDYRLDTLQIEKAAMEKLIQKTDKDIAQTSSTEGDTPVLASDNKH